MPTKKECSHCHLEFDAGISEEAEGEELSFCCSGCQSVYHILKDNSLGSFYDRLGGAKLSAPKQNFIDSSTFDSKAFYDKYVSQNGDISEVSLIIEGIHCSACVWLNEKALSQMEGVIEAELNFTNNKAYIAWDDSTLKLSAIIEMIRSIGYDAFAYDSKTHEESSSRERKSYYLKMALAIFAMMNTMWIAIAQYAGYFSGMEQSHKDILNFAEFVLATPVLFYSGWVFFRGAYFGLKRGVLSMDLLVAAGATLVYLYSIYIAINQKGEAYFDSVTMIITFILIGKFLEVLSKKSVGDALDLLLRDVPSEIKVLQNGEVVLKSLEDVAVGESYIISVGEKAYLDARVISGEGSFDESSLSGESRSVAKSVGSEIVSGTVSIDANVTCEVLREFKHSTLSVIAKLLEGAMRKKPRIERLANELSSYFASVVLTLFVLTFAWWIIGGAGFDRSFMVAVSVLIIACPCALALATPVATLVGLSNATKNAILFKEASSLEAMAKTDVVVLDKTGTITKGAPSVASKQLLGDVSLLHALASLSKHPISKAIAKYVEGEKLAFDEYKEVASKGIYAKKDGVIHLGGSAKLLREYGVEVSFKSCSSLFFYASGGELRAIFELEDEIKEDAKEFVQSAKEMGLRVVLLSGDEEAITAKVAHAVGLSEYYAQASPQDKLEFVRSLHSEGKKVVMVGDGINDTLALAGAEISIAMGSGSDIALEAGDVVLLDGSMRSLESAFRISKETYRLIKQNIAISLIYNSITIPLAMMGYIIPLVAALSMSLSSLLVVGNSLRRRERG